MNSRTIFVTGGAGFIGSNFVHYWRETYPDDHIIVYDALTYAASLDRLPQDDAHITFVKGDICDFTALKKAMEGSDIVVHFAAESHVDRSLAGREAAHLFIDTNVKGTLNVLYAAHELGVKHVHHVSTDEVFGELEFDDTEIFSETFPYNPKNPYSISKATADFYVREFAMRHDTPITITNCTNNYGPYQTPEKMIPRSISLLLAGEKIKLYTDEDGNPGKNIRDWLHVKDHCIAIDRVIHAALKGDVQAKGETFCVGGVNEVTNLDLVKTILAQMSELTDEKYRYEKNVELVKDRPGHDLRYAMDISKIKKYLGWEPSMTFAEGIRETVAWYISEEGQSWLKSLSDTVEDVRDKQSEAKK